MKLNSLDRSAYLEGVRNIEMLQNKLNLETNRIATAKQLMTVSDEDLKFMIDETPSSVLRFRLVREIQRRDGKTI